MIDFARARRMMVDNQLRTREVTDPAVLDAFTDVPREAFVPAARRSLTYSDADIRLEGANARFLPPATPFARLIQLLAIVPGERALTVGCGTGYAAAIMARLGAQVVALEEDASLADAAKAAHAAVTADGIQVSAEVVAGPLTAGAPTRAPFDVILLEGSVDEVPLALIEQLADGGRLAAVIGRGLTGRATLYRKSGSDIGARPFFDVALPPLPGFERIARFEFS